MRYERPPIWLLPVFSIGCALIGGVLVSGSTYWNLEAGMYAFLAGLVLGFGGYFFMGLRIPDSRSEHLMFVIEKWRTTRDQRDAASEQLAEAVDHLIEARRWLLNSPLEGVLAVTGDIRDFLDEVKNRA